MTEPKKFAYISSLRGFAALYVAAVHLRFAVSPTITAPDWLNPAISFGNVAVTLFFVLSAFTLCLSEEARHNEKNATLNFYIRRLFRIAPLFYLWTVLTCVRDIYLYQATHPWQALAENAAFVFNFIPGRELGIANASWSIGVEMAFYAIFPAIIATSKNLSTSLIWLIATLIVGEMWRRSMITSPSVQWPFPYVGILNQLPVFVMGIATYRLHKLIVHRRYAARAGYLLLLVAVLGAGLMAYPFQVTRVESSLYLRAMLCCSLVLGLGLAPLNVLVNRVTGFVGEISYSVYLAHVTGCIFIAKLSPAIYARLPVLAAFVTCYILLMAMVIPFSYMTYRFIEKPGNRLGRRLIDAASIAKPKNVIEQPST